jgi:hypothetical protein
VVENKDADDWLGMALNYANTIDLHGMLDRTTIPKQRNFLKLLWCCCFTSDALDALTLRRPAKLTSTGALVNCFSPSSHMLDPTSAEAEPYNQSLKDPTFTLIFLEMTRLSNCITRLMATQSGRGLTSGPARESSEQRRIARELGACHSELTDWMETLSPAARLHLDRPFETTQTSRSCISWRILLHMVYFATECALYLGEARRCQEEWDEFGARLCRLAQSRVRHAAQEMSGLAELAIQNQSWRYMPFWRYATRDPLRPSS